MLAPSRLPPGERRGMGAQGNNSRSLKNEAQSWNTVTHTPLDWPKQVTSPSLNLRDGGTDSDL